MNKVLRCLALGIMGAAALEVIISGEVYLAAGFIVASWAVYTFLKEVEEVG